MDILFAVLALLFGGLAYQTRRKNIAEARNENVETKEKVNEINKDVAKNQGLIGAEEEKQKDIKEKIENGKESSDDSINSLIDFFKKR
jgi:hypothetical protein